MLKYDVMVIQCLAIAAEAWDFLRKNISLNYHVLIHYGVVPIVDLLPVLMIPFLTRDITSHECLFHHYWNYSNLDWYFTWTRIFYTLGI